MRLTEEQKQQIPILYNELGTQKAVAEKLHISPATVSKYLKLSEIPQDNRIVEITPEIVDKINQLYSENKSASQIAKQLHIKSSQVYSNLNEENKKRKENQYKARDALWYYIIRLFGVNSKEEPVSEQNIILMNRFNKQGISYSEQYLTLKYYYEITRHIVREQYKTIGLIPYIYEQARTYYLAQKKKQEELEQDMIRQLNIDRKEIKVVRTQKKKKKKKINIEELVSNDTD